MNSKTFIIVLKQIGSLFILLGLIAGIPSIVSIIYSEWYPAAGFWLAALITSGLGYAMQHLFYRAEEPHYNQLLVGGNRWRHKNNQGCIDTKGLKWQVIKTFLSANTIKLIKFNGKLMLPVDMNEAFTKAASLAIMFFFLIPLNPQQLN